MISLPLPTGNGINDETTAACRQELRACVGRKQNAAAYHSLLPAVSVRYEAYVLGRGNPSTFGVSAHFVPGTGRTSDGDLLHGLYNSGNGTDDNIVAAVDAVSVGHCPYCGLRLHVRPRAFKHHHDHVVPISRYPEFSVLSTNLVKCCHDCNEAKPETTLTTAGEWRSLHPYFDEFLSGRLLRGEVFAENGTLQVRFFVETDGLQPSERARVLAHLQDLDVFPRLREMVALSFAKRMRDWRQIARSYGIQALRDSLRNQAEEEIASRPNDPEGVALAALAEAAVLEEVVGYSNDGWMTRIFRWAVRRVLGTGKSADGTT